MVPPPKHEDEFFRCDHADLTPFQKNFTLERVAKELAKNGIKASGDEVVMSGETGKRLNCLIFTGIVYYQALKHIILYKSHVCTRAPRDAVKRQPIRGKNDEGGLRWGVQERDNLLTMGASYILKDRCDQSDPYTLWVCDVCGLQAKVTAPSKVTVEPVDGTQRPVEEPRVFRKECMICHGNKVSLLSIPYAAKLLIQELIALGVGIRTIMVERQAPIKSLEQGNVNNMVKRTKNS
jgi:DNA-directed RNA polymerase beta subunit